MGRCLGAAWSIVGVLALALQTYARPLTPKLLLEAPRPASHVAVNAPGTAALLGVEMPSTTTGDVSEALYYIPLDPPASWEHKQVSLLQNGTNDAVFLDEDTFVFVKDQQLHCRSLREDKSELLLHLPKGIQHMQSVSTAKDTATLAFSAMVFDDGDIYAQHPEQEAAWQRAKVYDQLFIRHWDQWQHPQQRTQLFALDLYRHQSGWTVRDKIRNLLQATRLESPVGPLGDASDFSLSRHYVAFTAKDPDAPPAWHTRQHIYLVPLDGHAPPKRISLAENRGWAGTPVISPNEDMVLFLQQYKDGFESDRKVLQAYLMEEGQQVEIFPDWDVSPDTLSFSSDGRTLYAVVPEDEQRKVYAISVQGASFSDKHALVVDGSASSPIQLPDGRLIYVLSTLQSPNDVYLYDRGQTTRLTHFWQWSDAHRDVDMGPVPERFTYQGADGVKMYGWLIKPPSYEADVKAGKKLPLAVLLHGGPEGDWSNGWSTRWNPVAFAAAGFVVTTLDPSGSIGFGQALTDRVLEHWGDRVKEDVLRGVHHVLDTHTYLDRDRVVAAGASFGGYMVNWLQGHNQDKLFKAFVTHDGIFHLESMYYSTEELYFPESELGGLPWTSPHLYEAFSPHRHVAAWSTPHLIVHGGRDFRLSPAQGISAFTALQRRHVPSRLLFFPDEGHWVLDPRNSLQWHEQVLGWLQYWSRPPATALTDHQAVFST